jgi:hypothetical protein
MNNYHHTLSDFGISLLLPSGYYPTLDESNHALVEKRVDFDDQAPDNPELLMSVRRWRTNDAINISAEMCAHFHLYELEDAHQWMAPAQPFTSDGQVGSIQNFECHSGEVGFVATFDLINDIVTFRATWPSNYSNFGEQLSTIVESARYLKPGDVMSQKTSIVQPMIGVSAVPGDWLVDEPEYSTLRIVNGENVWLIHQMLELPVLDNSWIELPIEVGDSLHQFRMVRNAESTGLVGTHDGLRKYLIEGLVTNPADFSELIRISESVRIHPRIEWNV